MADGSIGATIHVSEGIPATFDAVGYAALTWTEYLGLVSIGDSGDEAEKGTVALVKDGRVQPYAGAIDGGTWSFSGENRLLDAGQIIVKANMNNDVALSIKLTDKDGTIYNKQFKAANGKYPEKTASGYEGYNWEAWVSSATVIV